MNKNEVTELMNYILSIYPTTFKFDDETVRLWFDDLQQYDLDDVKVNIAPLMKKEFPPKLVEITSGLRKKHEKTDWNKVETLCHRCHKPVALNEYNDHIERCSSVDYVIRETKKWFDKNLSRKDLFQMPIQEFEERYNKLLHYIYEHTTDISERTRIGFIFNPPSQERAKAFLGGQ